MPSTDVSVGINYTDRRTVRLNKFNDAEASRQFASLVLRAITEGYTISDASSISGGAQRDPYTIGVQVVLERKEPPKPAPVYRVPPPLTRRAFS